MLLHQTLDLEESWQEVPFVLFSSVLDDQSLEHIRETHPCSVDGICQAFAVVEGFE